MNKLNIVLCGIGGQGTVLANEVISLSLMSEYSDVKTTDIIGIGQRGGSVISHIKAGNEVRSPLIKEKEADILIAFEKYEALRWSKYLKPGGLLIVSDLTHRPNAVEMGLDEDIDVTDGLKKLDADILSIPQIHKYMNMSIAGALSHFTVIPEEKWIETLTATVKAKSVESNLEAFQLGRIEGENYKWRSKH